jgi:hypothetical protein
MVTKPPRKIKNNITLFKDEIRLKDKIRLEDKIRLKKEKEIASKKNEIASKKSRLMAMLDEKMINDAYKSFFKNNDDDDDCISINVTASCDEKEE